MAKSGHASFEFLYVFYILWWSHVEDCLDFGGVWAYAVVADDVAEQHAGGNPENAFFGVKLPFISVQCLESLVEVVDQSASVFGFHDDVINVGFNQVVAYFVMETLLDGTLIHDSGVF